MTSSNSRDVPEAGPSELKGVRVLVVEDSWDVATGLTMLLEAWGADIVGPAATADEASRLACEHTPSVALIDINLRGGERSYDLICRLHERGIHIVVITGYADVLPATVKAAVVLQKPIRDDGLFASLRAVTRHKET
jgi:CheY-like chemotaxis protein